MHSVIISEPLALLAGLTCGVVGFAAAGVITPDYNIRMWVGGSMSVIASVIVGAKINVLLIDLLALIVARPLSAVAGLKLLAVVANAWLAGHPA
jgi:hypothetical protein